jgi:putative ABC transport system substrate-binding protein
MAASSSCLDFLTLAHRDLIIRLAAHHRIPAGYALRIFAASGGLISYGVKPTDLFRRGASYVDRILKGAKPADLPVQQRSNLNWSSDQTEQCDEHAQQRW